MLKSNLANLYQLFSLLFFDPLEMIRKWRGLPYYLKNKSTYKHLNIGNCFKFSWRYALPVLHERFLTAGRASGHYFWQDLWAAKQIFDSKVSFHVDVGSRIDGFIAHILPFCSVTYVDIRGLDIVPGGMTFKKGSIMEMPFESDSVISLSCLHVIEHVGLGRYGDPVQPEGYIIAAKELCRVLSPGRLLYIGTPVGK